MTHVRVALKKKVTVSNESVDGSDVSIITITEEVTVTNEPDVKVGQVWEDCDKRCAGRRVRVVEVSDTHAYVQDVVSNRRARLAKRRMKPTSTGFRLVEDV